MKIELAKFKAYHARSEETLNFTAVIVVNGVKAGTVENGGHGGPCNPHFTDPAVRVAVQNWVEALPPEPSEYGPIKMNLDFFFASLADDMVKKADEAKRTRMRNRFAMDAKVKGLHAFVATFTSARGGFDMLWQAKHCDLAQARATADAKAVLKKAQVVSVEVLA